MTDKLQFDTNYDDISIDNVYVGDNIDGVLDQKDLNITPFDVIKKLAEKIGQDVKDPEPSCKRCYGRGYVGRDSETKAPIPCKCVFPNFHDTENDRIFNRTRKLSRKERRRQQKNKRRG